MRLGACGRVLRFLKGLWGVVEVDGRVGRGGQGKKVVYFIVKGILRH